MYWQVYLHKTVVSAENMLVKIIQRAKERIAFGEHLYSGSGPLDFFLSHAVSDPEEYLKPFSQLDDHDVMSALKLWINHEDKVLSLLSSRLINRQLLKVKLQADPFDKKILESHRARVIRELKLNPEEAEYFVFTGENANTTYNPEDEKINILFKDGEVRDISRVDNALISRSLATAVKKFYICYLA
jgi:HD superfamily phosphohydrolase